MAENCIARYRCQTKQFLSFSIIDRVSSFAGMISGIMAVCCALIIVYGATSRYVFNHPTVWEMRITIYLLIAFGFLSACFGMKEDAHVRVDLFLNQVSLKTRAIFDVFGHLFVGIFSLTYSYFGYKIFLRSFLSGEADAVIYTLPVWPAKAAMMVGMILLFLQASAKLLESCRTLRTSAFDEPVKRWDKPVLLILLFSGCMAAGLFALKYHAALGLTILLVSSLFAGIPVAFGLGLIGIAGFLMLLGTKALVIIPNVGYASLNSDVLISLPLFILAGQIFQLSGLSKEIFRVCNAFLGNIPGGVGAATLLSCGIFAAISGSSVANAATMGMIAIPELLKLGYDRRLTYGLIAAGGTIGILIPPSASMILFGVVTDESIGKLFMAGLFPGIIFMIILMLWVIFIHKRNLKRQKTPIEAVKTDWKEKLRALRRAWAALLLPVIMLGGMYSGVFTATEAAAVAVVYALIITICAKGISPSEWHLLIRDSTKNISMILMIFIGAMILGNFVTMAQIPQKLTAAILGANLSSLQFLLILTVFLGIMGMFMEAGAITLVLVPVLYPVIQALGINIMWFAVFFTINMEVACVSPPVGLNLYVVQRIAGASFKDVVKGIFLFIPMFLLILVIIWLFPWLSTWLPSTME